MKQHMIVCGAGASGRQIIMELHAARISAIVIDTDEHALDSLRQLYPDAELEYISGDATDDDILGRANIPAARGLVTTLPSDKDNLYIVVATRQQNPSARICTRVAELSHADKLKRVGADSVVPLSFIGGRRIASEMMRPYFVRFLDDMLKDPRASYRLSAVTIEPGSKLAGITLREAGIRERYGMSVLAVGDGTGPWRINPTPTERLAAGTVMIVLGSLEQVEPLQAAASVTA